MVNTIKLNQFNEKDIRLVILKDNDDLWSLIVELTDSYNTSEFQCAYNSLLTVLEKQWKLLDQVMSTSNSYEDRGKYAVEAQQVNKERVRWKNEINRLAGSSHEFKKYGDIK